MICPPGQISLDHAELSTAEGKLDANGLFHHPSDSLHSGQVQVHFQDAGMQLAALQPLQKKSPGAAGAINLTADAKGSFTSNSKASALTLSDVAARFSATNLKVQNQDAGNLSASAERKRWSNGIHGEIELCRIGHSR